MSKNKTSMWFVVVLIAGLIGFVYFFAKPQTRRGCFFVKKIGYPMQDFGWHAIYVNVTCEVKTIKNK